MPGKTPVPIPQTGEDLRHYFAALVRREGGLLPALDLSVVEFDELAQLTEISVTSAEATDAGVAVGYSVSWTAFHACDDKTVSGRHERMARGRAEGGNWVFDVVEPLPGRHAGDEL
jgi:hypothetical protein